MPCDRCEELELRYLNQTEAYISLVERQCRLFRNAEAQAGRELDQAIVAAKTAMYAGLRTWAEHRESHPNAQANLRESDTWARP
jgi:hypothetical protein